ncbi:hypothetical protein M513_06966 [Trichuris suis]|uniref:Uncharacterized protein n=1 Tax=Trichuris suis TaxID=68888 RepID=A0A085M4H5_9BILA|nr:hypothetical protein M513_06966 [Trichuris suis]
MQVAEGSSVIADRQSIAKGKRFTSGIVLEGGEPFRNRMRWSVTIQNSANSTVANKMSPACRPMNLKPSDDTLNTSKRLAVP